MLASVFNQLASHTSRVLRRMARHLRPILVLPLLLAGAAGAAPPAGRTVGVSRAGTGVRVR